MIVEPISYYSSNAAIFGSPDLETRIRNGSLHTVGYAEAVIRGQAPDGGLYMPTRVPSLSMAQISAMKDQSYAEIFVQVMEGFFEGVLSKKTLETIAHEAYTFEPYIEPITKKDFISRLDEGPTAAFKDYAAQVLFRTIESLRREEPVTEIEYRQKLRDIKLLTYIVATSGDTGSAMGAAIHNRSGMWMPILHSSNIPGQVSELQAKQMSTLGDNVYALRLDTDFDGCQKIASDLMKDSDLVNLMNLSSANSINWGRLIPQAAYYFYSYSRIANNGEEVVFSVPSGNFGDAVAGLYAKIMGLPIKILIAMNENDVFHRFYHGQEYIPTAQSHISPSNSMNVNWPSNVRRLFQLYGGQLIEGTDPSDPQKRIVKYLKMPDINRMKQDIFSYRISDAETDMIIEEFWKQNHRISEFQSTIEPHGAVAWGAAQKLRQEGYNGKIISFETAHPAKFPERIRAMGIEPEMPRHLRRLKGMDERFYIIEPTVEAVKNKIKELYQIESRKVA